ncbi:carbohydrate ABC transporter permease [Rhizobium sp. S152]|uniref:carbohydrate ABC transporter permease n=1 Tax=Rhizobium sp. S152 TaxID=3055038 RepID=UPI0025A96D30|nr:carbohydrate ABC transporter permease [Rhizobium sp. S152]MDM9625265.1 carbohydrate ABC transporter permease [Rhizobium sp. S152]
MKRASLRYQLPLFVALAGLTVVNLIPVIWALLISLKQPVDAFAVPPSLIFEPTLEFHYEIWFERGLLGYLVNSLIISAGTVVVSVTCGTLAAYGLTRIRAGRVQAILIGLMAVRMIPHLLLAIPFFVLARYFGLIDTHFVMILALVAINQPFTIWLMKGFFDDVPKELYEAATVDGCSIWQAFYKVALPVVRPGIWVAALFSFLLSYNEFLLALVLTGPNSKTLPVAISEYGAEDITYWSLSAAGSIGIILPVLLFMGVLQRQLVRGFAAGAVKG